MDRGELVGPQALELVMIGDLVEVAELAFGQPMPRLLLLENPFLVPTGIHSSMDNKGSRDSCGSTRSSCCWGSGRSIASKGHRGGPSRMLRGGRGSDGSTCSSRHP